MILESYGSLFYFHSTKYDNIVVTVFVMLGLNLTFLKGSSPPYPIRGSDPFLISFDSLIFFYNYNQKHGKSY